MNKICILQMKVSAKIFLEKMGERIDKGGNMDYDVW